VLITCISHASCVCITRKGRGISPIPYITFWLKKPTFSACYTFGITWNCHLSIYNDIIEQGTYSMVKTMASPHIELLMPLWNSSFYSNSHTITSWKNKLWKTVIGGCMYSCRHSKLQKSTSSFTAPSLHGIDIPKISISSWTWEPCTGYIGLVYKCQQILQQSTIVYYTHTVRIVCARTLTYACTKVCKYYLLDCIMQAHWAHSVSCALCGTCMYIDT